MVSLVLLPRLRSSGLSGFESLHISSARMTRLVMNQLLSLLNLVPVVT